MSRSTEEILDLRTIKRTIKSARGFLLNEDGNTLVAQRSGINSGNKYKWEFLGGTIESDETPVMALTREIFEESGLQIEYASDLVKVGERIIPDEKYRDQTIELWLPESPIYIDNDRVEPHEHHQDYRWMPHAEVGGLDLTTDSRTAWEYFGRMLLEQVNVQHPS